MDTVKGLFEKSIKLIYTQSLLHDISLCKELISAPSFLPESCMFLNQFLVNSSLDYSCVTWLGQQGIMVNIIKKEEKPAPNKQAPCRSSSEIINE